MNYRITPFHLFAGFLISYGAYFFVILDMETAGLGGFFPYILIFIGLAVIGFDLLFQYFLNRMIIVYVIELLVIISIMIWYFIKFGFQVI